MFSTTTVGNAAALSLRRELKDWENSFSAAHEGRKPGRADVKDNATIDAKYKEYGRLVGRDSSNAHSTPRKSAKFDHPRRDDPALKERAANAVSVTPRKQTRELKTLQPPVLSPVQEEPTPACVRTALGPTPQKDGAVLGIFDMLPAATPSKDTPSKPSSTLFATRDAAVGATPSKPSTTRSSDLRHSRTPQSSGKRFFPDTFAGTPLKRKRDEEAHASSTTKRQFATPSFLRRSFPMAQIEEEDGDALPSQPPFKKRGLVRSLSSIIQGLKKQEQERMDDDWDIMNEMENEEETPQQPHHKKKDEPEVRVEDSQGVEMPLGPDQAAESSEDDGQGDGGAFDAEGRPRKVWKKKGQKRQTRRTNMRPAPRKPQKADDAAQASGSDSEVEAVAETQLPDGKTPPPRRRVSTGDGDDDDFNADANPDSGYLPEEEASKASQKASTEKTRKGKAAKNDKTGEEKDAGKKAKKVSAQANPNFRRLNIKNKNSKAKGRGGRFGKR